MMAFHEPVNLSEWSALTSTRQKGRLFTCGRPGRATFGRGKKPYTHKTFSEAQAAQRKLATHVLANSSGLGLAGSPRERLGAYLREWAGGQKARLAPRTIERYETFAAQAQQDALGSVLLARLSPRILEDYYRRRLEAGLSPTTVNHQHRMIHKALRDAVRLDLIVQNPAAMAEAPKRTRSRPDVWSEPEVLMFLAEAEASSRYYRLYLFISPPFGNSPNPCLAAASVVYST